MDFTSAIEAGTLIFAILTFIISSIMSGIQNRKVANRETYQRLELAAIDLFRFEADHLEVIRPVWETATPVPPAGSAENMVVNDYLCQILNLFEMAIRLRKEKVVPPEVFGSWVKWYFNVVESPHFEELWEELKTEYTSDLRSVLDFGLANAHSGVTYKQRADTFFTFVGKQLNCKHILNWNA